jgi:hypothetical protein
VSRAGRAGALLAGWTILLVMAVVVLGAAGGALAPPPWHDPGAMGSWLEQRQPAEAAFAVLRLVALALAWYLLAVTAVSAAARTLRMPALVAAVDRVTVPAVRRLVSGAVGLSMAASALTGVAGAAGAADNGAAPPVELMRRLPDAGAEATPGPPVTMRRLPDAAAPMAPPPQAAPADAPPGAAPARPAPADAPPGPTPAPAPTPAPMAPRPPGTASATWTVAPGDCFWSVAERLVAQAGGRPPSDGEIAPYWRTLVTRNRAVLRDPGNPDLLYPGQVLAVPVRPGTGDPGAGTLPSPPG